MVLYGSFLFFNSDYVMIFVDVIWGEFRLLFPIFFTVVHKKFFSFFDVSGSIEQELARIVTEFESFDSNVWKEARVFVIVNVFAVVCCSWGKGIKIVVSSYLKKISSVSSGSFGCCDEFADKDKTLDWLTDGYVVSCEET